MKISCKIHRWRVFALPAGSSRVCAGVGRENEGDEKWKREREREKVEGYADEGGARGGEQSDGRSGKPGSDGSLGVRAGERWRRRKRASKKHALSLSLSLSRAGRKAKRNDRDSHAGAKAARLRSAPPPSFHHRLSLLILILATATRWWWVPQPRLLPLSLSRRGSVAADSPTPGLLTGSSHTTLGGSMVTRSPPVARR